MPLYLASTSPRRRQLLAEAGITFTLFAVPVDEEALAEAYRGPLPRLGEYLARAKARAARAALRQQGGTGAVLAADTTVLLDGRSLAKPADAAEATAMLRTLRGRAHVVATGVAVAEGARLRSATAATTVQMRDYSDAEIAAYVATGDPLDKAGGYSIQHPNFSPVASFTGCHLGVIGLPLCLVRMLLAGLEGEVPVVGGVCPESPTCTSPFPRLGAP